jgi:hypothetical protein
MRAASGGCRVRVAREGGCFKCPRTEKAVLCCTQRARALRQRLERLLRPVAPPQMERSFVACVLAKFWLISVTAIRA